MFVVHLNCPVGCHTGKESLSSACISGKIVWFHATYDKNVPGLPYHLIQVHLGSVAGYSQVFHVLVLAGIMDEYPVFEKLVHIPENVSEFFFGGSPVCSGGNKEFHIIMFLKQTLHFLQHFCSGCRSCGIVYKYE